MIFARVAAEQSIAQTQRSMCSVVMSVNSIQPNSGSTCVRSSDS
jgi:hypothetical protein